ncbi:MAG: acyl carrier protein [Metamycoplasmataceae bacterium]
MINQDVILNIVKKRTNKKISISTDIRSIGLDSLDLVEIVMEIEKEFDIKIPDEKLTNIKNIDDLIKLIENK